MSTRTDPLASSLGRALRRSGHYALRKVDGHLNIYLDYSDKEEFGDRFKRAMLVRECISHVEDFETHVDDLEEESRCLAADFLAYG